MSTSGTETTSFNDPLVGQLLDRYRVLGKLGEGGMGAVYAVEHVMLRKRMAMKLLRLELSRNQDLVTRFQNEAIAASRIGQENIVAVTDFGRTPEGLVYFVMEELQGRSLGEAIHAEPGFSIDRTLAIAVQVCRALHAAHAVGIVHRDLKPENIILVRREPVGEFVKVLDFGISKMSEANPIHEGSARLTQMGMIVGTPEYMAPEQAAGKSVDQRCDIYSLGVVLYEMLTGRLPFEADNSIQLLIKHQTEPVPLLVLRGDLPVPAELERLVRRALAKRPEDRQQSMAEMLGELQSCAGGADPAAPEQMLSLLGRQPRPLQLTPTPLAVPSTPAPAPAVPDPIGAEELKSLRPRRTGLWVTLGVLLLAAAGWATSRQLGPEWDRQKASAPPPPSPVLEASSPRLVEPPKLAPLPTLPVPALAARAPPAPAVAPAIERRPTVSHKARPAAPPARASRTNNDLDPYQKVDDLKTPY